MDKNAVEKLIRKESWPIALSGFETISKYEFKYKVYNKYQTGLSNLCLEHVFGRLSDEYCAKPGPSKPSCKHFNYYSPISIMTCGIHEESCAFYSGISILQCMSVDILCCQLTLANLNVVVHGSYIA